MQNETAEDRLLDDIKEEAGRRVGENRDKCLEGGVRSASISHVADLGCIASSTLAQSNGKLRRESDMQNDLFISCDRVQQEGRPARPRRLFRLDHVSEGMRVWACGTGHTGSQDGRRVVRKRQRDPRGLQRTAEDCRRAERNYICRRTVAMVEERRGEWRESQGAVGV